MGALMCSQSSVRQRQFDWGRQVARKLKLFSCSAIALVVFASPLVRAQGSSVPARRLITENIDEAKRVTLPRNTRPEANAGNDRGAVRDTYPMPHMLMQLRRPPEREQALQKFIDELHTEGSPNFHHWITATEFGNRFGLASEDLHTVTQWLRSHGLEVNVVYPSGMLIDFSGTAAQVRQAFRTAIHQLQVKGQAHIANMSDPTVPAAIAPAVVGIVSLHDFAPHSMHKMRSSYTFNSGAVTEQAVVPADLATIYNLNPLFSAGISGQGQTVVVIEDTDVFNVADWATFRSTFGLSGYTAGSFTQVHPAPPSGTNNCADPGVNGNEIEAILDGEYASAAAPSAAIELASCSDGASFGGLIALQNLLNQTGTPPSIVSISYGECEAYNGEAANTSYSSAYAQAVTEGVSVFVSSGDEGAAGCDPGSSVDAHGIGVNGLASTNYNVAVGGTDFGDTFAGTNSTYWNATNTSSYGSALSYPPEIPWNDSCASSLIAGFNGYGTTYGTSGYCNSGGPQTVVSASGGPSACATGSASIPGVVSGTCAGWLKPDWQSVIGNPSDQVRDLPDVSLFAANGAWQHFYLICDSDPTWQKPCTGAPSTWVGAGGTSFAAPILAGLQALVNQNAGSAQGNPNPVYYALAGAEYGNSGDSACNSTLGNGVSSACTFYDVTQGDIDVNCNGNVNCYLPSGTMGVLSTSNNSYSPAFAATTGWDFATGLGTVNATNLVSNWPVSGPNFSLSASPGGVGLTQGGNSSTVTVTITPVNGFASNVALSASNLPSGVTASFSVNPATSASTLTLSATYAASPGTSTITVVGTSPGLTHTATVTLTVTAGPNFSLSSTPSNLTISQGSGTSSTIMVAPSNGFAGNVNLTASGLPNGVTASFTPNPTGSSSTLTLSSSFTATLGTASVTITGTVGTLSHTTPLTLTVLAGPLPDFSLSASPTSVTLSQGDSGGTSTITVMPVYGFSGNVALSTSGLPRGVSATFNPVSTGNTSTLTLIASSTAQTGNVMLTITGISGNLSHNTSVGLTVNAATPNPLSFSSTPNSYSVGTQPAGVVSGDFNADGNPDLAVSNQGGGVSVLLGNGDGTFQNASNYGAGARPSGIVAGKFNNSNSNQDLAVVNSGDNTLSVFIGNGDGTFQGAVPYPVGNTPMSVAVGDLNGDGSLDVVTANQSGTVSVLLGNGDGTFQPFVNYSAGLNPTFVAFGDFNGDGKADLVVVNGQGISVLLGKGDGTFQSAVAYMAGTNPTAVSVGDFNSDGILDVAVTDQCLSGTDCSSGLVSVLLGNGDGTFQSPLTYSAGLGPAALAVGDFNGDGKLDLAVANPGANSVSFLLGNGDGTFQSAAASSVGTGPVALTSGDFNIDGKPDLAVANGGSNDVTILLNGTASGAPAFTSPNGATLTVGKAGLLTITAAGFPKLTEMGNLPAGLVFNDNRNGSASLTGTPAPGTGGSYPITLTANNSVGSATQNFTLTVNQAPAITSPNATAFQVGVSGNFTVATSGFPLPALTSGTLPSGVTFTDNGNGTGTLAGIPSIGTAGVHAITLTATNAAGNATQTLTLTINQVPVIASPGSAAFAINTPGSFTVTASGYPAVALSLSAGTLPNGVTFVDNGNGTAAIAGTASTAGYYNVTISATNAAGSTTQSFTLTIGSAPTITSVNSATFLLGVFSSFTVTTSGFPPPALKESGAKLNGETFSDNGNGTGVLSGTPAKTGGFNLFLTASNSLGSVTQNFTLTVDQLPAITSASSASFKVGASSSFTVTATGFPSPTITESGALPAGVSFSSSQLSGTPAAGTAGTYPIVFTATSSAGQVSQNFSLTVVQPNLAPSFTSATATTFTVGVAASFTVTTNGYPAPTITESGTLPSGVKFTNNGNGTATLSGTPAAGTGKTYSIRFTASNGVGTNATQSFTLTVNQPPAITSASSAGFVQGTGGTFTVKTTGFPVPALGATGLPTGVTFTDNKNGTGTLNVTSSTALGVYALTFSASNGVGSTANQNFSLTVGQPAAITSTNNFTFTVGTSGSFTVTATGFPAPKLSESGTLPRGLTFTASIGVLSGTPSSGAGGSYKVTFTASNGVGTNATQSFTLIVDQSSSITSSTSTSFTVGTAGSFSIRTSGYPAPVVSEAGALPNGVTFNPSTNILSGTPVAGTSGTYPISFTASNGIGTNAVQNFTLTVRQAPAITSPNSITFPVATADTFTVTATGFPIPTLTETLSKPSWLTFTNNGNGTGTLKGTPPAGSSGSYNLSFTASNGTGSNSVQSFTLTVQ
jgi:hypothetical protein